MGEATYADKLTVEEFAIDPTRPALDARTASCAPAIPRPGAWCTVGGRRVKVWRARLGGSPRPSGRRHRERCRSAASSCRPTASLELVEVQPEGKRAMTGAALVAGLPRDRAPARPP